MIQGNVIQKIIIHTNEDVVKKAFVFGRRLSVRLLKTFEMVAHSFKAICDIIRLRATILLT